MVAFHPFSMARESVLGMWTQPLQARRQAPDALLMELFVGLHGMLLMNIQHEHPAGRLQAGAGTLLGEAQIGGK